MPTHCKMEALSIFSKICQKCVFVFFNIYNIRKGNEAVRNSGYAEVCFTTNSPLKMLPHHFGIFIVPILKQLLQKFYEKSYHFLASSKFLLCHKIFRSGNRWQLNDYQKYLLYDSRNLLKNVGFFICLISVNCRYMKYLI